MNQLSEILKGALDRTGLSQAQAAEQAGIERKTFNSYVLGRTEPDLETLRRIIKVLGIETEVAGLLWEHFVPQQPSAPAPNADFLAGKLAGKDDLIAEKEARRLDMERQIQIAQQEKDKLFQALAETRQTINGVLSTVVTNLSETKAETSLALSYHRTWVEYTAEIGAAGDEKKRIEISQRLNTLLEQQIPEELRVDKKAGGRRPRRG